MIIVNNPAASAAAPNYLINSGFQVAQAATSATITAGTATPTASLGYPVVDSWFCYSVGGNPTLAQVVGSNTTANRLQLTGAASTTSVGIGQRLEARNTTSLANKTVTLSFECSNSLLTSLTVVANRPTTTSNTFGTIGTPTKTLINSTNVAINSTLTRYSLTFTCPPDVDKGLEILFLLGAQTSGTFVLSNVKLEEGSVATTFVPTIYDNELFKCKRYFEVGSFTTSQYNVVGNNWLLPISFKNTKFGLPGIIHTNLSFAGFSSLINIGTGINGFNFTTNSSANTGQHTVYFDWQAYSYIP